MGEGLNLFPPLKSFMTLGIVPPFQLHVRTYEIGYGKIRGVFIYKGLTTVPGTQPLHNSWLLKDIASLATSNHPGTALQKTASRQPRRGRVIMDPRLPFQIQSIPL